MRSLFAVFSLLALPLIASAGEFQVGPGQTYASIGAVPWETLGPGDTVLIHARPTPYAEKWVIGRNGTQAAPLTVRGVPDAQGRLPIIHGEGATTRSQLNYWNEERGIIKIGGSNTPADTLPSYIVIEGLHLRRARGAFTGRNGASSYNANAAGIFIVYQYNHFGPLCASCLGNNLKDRSAGTVVR